MLTGLLFCLSVQLLALFERKRDRGEIADFGRSDEIRMPEMSHFHPGIISYAGSQSLSIAGKGISVNSCSLYL